MAYLKALFYKWFRRSVIKNTGRQFQDALDDEMTETFLGVLLDCMWFNFVIDSNYRKNIQHFEGRYQFRDKDGSVKKFVRFTNGMMWFKEEISPDADLTVTFKDGRALRDFLLSPRQDILKSLLNNEVLVRGNLNYLFKFAFLANHLRLEFLGKLP
jgi:hypothetical protein